MSSLRDKTITGVLWSSVQKIGTKGIDLVVSILLARILTPEDFGLIASLAIFIAIAQCLSIAGFKQALIQKKHPDEEDYSAVFYINLSISILLYALLFFGAPWIAQFYDQPILTGLARVLGIIFVINAFSYVQETKLTKEMRFKTLTVIHVPSTLISGGVAIAMAYLGYGVWSIIAQRLVMRLVYTVQLWFYSKWQPLPSFNKTKAKKLFSFGGNLMVAGMIQAVFGNIYPTLIGKLFPMGTLGLYNYAKKLVDLPTQTLSSVVSGVTFPAFSAIQDDNKKLKGGYRMVIQQILFWLCPLLILGGVLAEPLFSFVLTDKWLPAVPFFRLLCVVGIFMPLNAYNINILNVKGRSDLVLKLQIIKKVFLIIGIVISIPLGVYAMITFLAINSVVAYFINSYYSGKFINYPVKEQLKDIFPILILSSVVGGIVWFTDFWLQSLADWSRIFIGVVLGVGLYWLYAWLTKFAPYQEVIAIYREKKP